MKVNALTTKTFFIGNDNLDELASISVKVNSEYKYLYAYDLVTNEWIMDEFVSWSSSNNNVATVDNLGIVYGKAVGDTKITCILKATGEKATVKVRVFK